jgi:hypothetical protein
MISIGAAALSSCRASESATALALQTQPKWVSMTSSEASFSKKPL